MIERYEVVLETEPGNFVRAPDPPPPEWRERKGICLRCGEKVFVKAGPIRSFWTHGKGKTCVPKPNPVAEAVEAAEYAKNRGALTDGDEELKARFAESVGSPPSPPPEEERLRPEGVSDEEWQRTQSIFAGRGGDSWTASEEDKPQVAAEPPHRAEPVSDPLPFRRVVVWPTPVETGALPVRCRPYIQRQAERPVSGAAGITYAVSLGWVEASLVMSGLLKRVKDVADMPPVGTFGRMAIHYMSDFPRATYDAHVRHALQKYPGCTIPPYEEIDGQRKSYYWGVASFAVVDEDGTSNILLAKVVRTSTLVHRISEGRKVWPIDRFDAQMIR